MDPSLQYLELLAAGKVTNRFISREQAHTMIEDHYASHQEWLTQSDQPEHQDRNEDETPETSRGDRT